MWSFAQLKAFAAWERQASLKDLVLKVQWDGKVSLALLSTLLGKMVLAIHITLLGLPSCERPSVVSFAFSKGGQGQLPNQGPGSSQCHQITLTW